MNTPAEAPLRQPSEFRYRENQAQPKLQPVRRWFQRIVGVGPDLPEPVLRTLGEMYYEADPVAEAFVDEVYLHGPGAAEGRRLLDLALERGIDAVPDAPASMRRLFAELETPPNWYDARQFELGRRLFRRYGPTIYRYMGAVTLEGYRENSVAKPLVMTGAYVADSTRQRFLETAAFWRDVSDAGGMDPGGVGRKTAMRVRVMHVFVRRRLLKHPLWREQDWGVPISQADALITLMAGSIMPALHLQLMGFRPTREEKLAIMHFWRYVGHVMGVQPRWYPENISDAAQFGYYVFTKGVDGAGEDFISLSRSFAQAFLAPGQAGQTWGRRLRDWLEHRILLGTVNCFVSGPTRRRAGIPSAGLWNLYPLAGFPLLFLWETLRRGCPPLERLAYRHAEWRLRRWFAHHMHERKAEYTAVSQFTR
ncbi:DUF2236 domain-containing protein [Solimonas sp. K1W22B-7]|uniref:oxygenase MpaB family protein n=1 Tax=Solimonas sp. K1W22B-7 TaxID=2303331 RepID=UPI000E336C67|nr:oxygenase MpaB family protein [Solimonas sp. K1W22B-7]AXQ30247.1 DUF2236 domain-containing protein [Solimonas sp. K1W22B-7]